MIRKMMIGLAALVSGATFSAASQAQDLKLYAFSSGALTIGKGALLNTASMTDIIQVPVGFYRDQAPQGECAVRHRQQRQDHHRSVLLGRSCSRR